MPHDFPLRAQNYSSDTAPVASTAAKPAKVSTILSPGSLWAMAKDTGSAWMDDFAPSMGAAISYYTAFSIAPMLIIVIAVAGLVFGSDTASGYIYAQLGALLGDQGGATVQSMVESAQDTGEGILATVIGVALLLVSATTVFAELQTDLDRIWKSPAVAKPEGFWGLIRSRLSLSAWS